MVENGFTIHDAQLKFRNFEGRADDFTPEGNRKFSIKLAPEQAQELINDGWHVRVKPNNLDPDADPWYLLDVKVNYRTSRIPPKIYLVSPRTKKITLMEEADLKNLDVAEISKADLDIVPYNWELKNGNKGTTAYLSEAYITIEESVLAGEYSGYFD